MTFVHLEKKKKKKKILFGNESIAKGKQYVAMRKEADTKRISEGKWSTKKAEL
jgi:hypothetical protein